MSKKRPVIRKLVYLESSEDDDEDEIDPVDLPPLKSCLAPIITAPASEDKSEPEDGSIPTLETDLSLDDDWINIPGTEGRGSSLVDHVDHVEKLVLSHLMNGHLLCPTSLVSGILLNIMKHSCLSSPITL